MLMTIKKEVMRSARDDVCYGELIILKLSKDFMLLSYYL